MIPMNWTTSDEAKLQELLARKEASHQRDRDCVTRAVNQWHYYNMSESDIVDELIKDAYRIRLVLEPFDEEGPL